MRAEIERRAAEMRLRNGLLALRRIRNLPVARRAEELRKFWARAAVDKQLAEGRPVDLRKRTH